MNANAPANNQLMSPNIQKQIINAYATELWDVVKEVIQAVFEDGDDPKSRSVAVSLIDKMESFEFIFIGHMMMCLSGMTNILSQTLQQKNQNISLVVRLIQLLKDELGEFRNNGWEELLKEVTEFCFRNEFCVKYGRCYTKPGKKNIGWEMEDLYPLFPCRHISTGC
ncbi:uncharacterized protein LOC127263604 isoform X1 [Andrographis paniculata]|uniref:uncharacterized protein LOC127263604 isoform X1 n=1 Tax=Andrographis paniculata TaxID=175694 RepID=UPI0021E79BE4|nr:uncharacterized protein LOC127263604 isoform X1 [Andrographis paniculata]